MVDDLLDVIKAALKGKGAPARIEDALEEKTHFARDVLADPLRRARFERAVIGLNPSHAPLNGCDHARDDHRTRNRRSVCSYKGSIRLPSPAVPPRQP